MAQRKTEFRNDSGGVLGVITIEPGGKEVPLPVRPGESIWLSEDEQIATANAPKEDKDNPFINGDLTLITQPQDIKNRRPIGESQEVEGGSGDSEAEAKQRQEAQEAKAKKEQEDRLQREEEAARLEQGQQEAHQADQTPERKTPPKRQSPDETAAPPQAQGTAAQGSRAAGEEVATPEAVPAS